MARGFPAARPLDDSPEGRRLRKLERWLDLPEGLLRLWAELLASYHPLGYAGPPPPEAPSYAIRRKALLLLYEERAADNRSLRHPNDAKQWRGEPIAIGRQAPPVRPLEDVWTDSTTSITDVLTAWREAREHVG